MSLLLSLLLSQSLVSLQGSEQIVKKKFFLNLQLCVHVNTNIITINIITSIKITVIIITIILELLLLS